MHEDREAPHPVRRTGSPFLRALVFLPRSQTAADVALGLVLLHHRLDLQIQRAVIQWQPLRQVLVDGGLADAELLGGGADRGPVFYEVMGQLHGPLLQIVANRAPLLYTFAAGLCLCGGRGGYAVWMHKKGRSAPPFVRRAGWKPDCPAVMAAARRTASACSVVKLHDRSAPRRGKCKCIRQKRYFVNIYSYCPLTLCIISGRVCSINERDALPHPENSCGDGNTGRMDRPMKRNWPRAV